MTKCSSQDGSYGIEGESSVSFTASTSGENPWCQLPQARIPREFSGVVAWKRDNLVIVGGSSFDGKKLCLGSVEVFNFSSNSWTLLEATLHQPRRHCAVAIVDDRFLYVMGGNSNCDRSFVDIDTVERLDLLNPREFVVLTQRLPFPIRNAAALSWKSRIVIVGGYASSHENVLPAKKGRKSTDAEQVPGYCRNLWVWDTSTNACIKLRNLSQPRWLPAIAIVRGELLVAGGYNGKRWLNDVESYHILRSQNTGELNEEHSSIPCIPSTSPRIRAFWTRMNQLTLLSDNMMYTWDWGSPKWREEKIPTEGNSTKGPVWKADDLSVPRSASSANCVVCLDSNRMLWKLDRPCYNAASIDMLKAELLRCENDVQKAANVGFWELAALDKAASAHLRIPRLKDMLSKLGTIQWLQKQKDSLIEGFALSQATGAWDDCKTIALDIRDIDEDLEEAHGHLRELENNDFFVDGKPHQKDKPRKKQVVGTYASPLRRKRPILLQAAKAEFPHLTNSSRQGELNDCCSVPSTDKSYDATGISFEITSVGEFDLSKDLIIEDIPFAGESEPPERKKTPLRRQSSLLLHSLLSERDLKELARSSAQQSVDAVYM